jgi:hypothetical protein
MKGFVTACENVIDFGPPSLSPMMSHPVGALGTATLVYTSGDQ